MANELKRAALVDAARDLNKTLGLSPAIDDTLGMAEVREQMINAIILLKVDDGSKLAPETLVVVSKLRGAVLTAVPGFRAALIAELRKEGPHEDEDEQEFEARIINEAGHRDDDMVTEVQDVLDALCEDVEGLPVIVPDDDEKVAEGAKGADKVEKKIKEPKKIAEKKKLPRIVRFRPVRRGSHFATILAAVLENDVVTIEDVADAADISTDKAMLALKRARITNGIDHVFGGVGELTIVLPKGIDAESVWHKPKERVRAEKKTPSTKSSGRTRQKQPQRIQAMYDAAKRGEMPEPIVMTSTTNMNNQRHFDALRKYAEDGDWNAVRSYKTNGSNYYAEMIRRYRELLILAHDHQEEEAA